MPPTSRPGAFAYLWVSQNGESDLYQFSSSRRSAWSASEGASQIEQSIVVKVSRHSRFAPEYVVTDMDADASGPESSTRRKTVTLDGGIGRRRCWPRADDGGSLPLFNVAHAPNRLMDRLTPDSLD